MKNPVTIDLSYKENLNEMNLSAFLWNQDTSKTVILVGGDGDTKISLSPLAEKLITKGINTNILTISFSNVEKKDYKPLKTQGSELPKVIDWVIGNLGTEIILIGTSAGAYSVTKVASNRQYRNQISKIIYIDPADYTTAQIREIRPSTWKETQKYQSKDAVVANEIKNIKGIKISVVNLTIRNCTKEK